MLTRRDAGTDPTVLDRLRIEVAAGVPPADADALPERCQRALRLADAVGAPMLDAVDAARAAQDDVDAARRAVAVASAQTRVVAAGLVVAPVVLVPGLGRLVGADLLAFYGSGLGLLVLAVGATLLAVGTVIVLLLVRRVDRARRAPRRSGGPLATLGAVGAGGLTWTVLTPALAPLAALGVHHVVSQRSPARVPPSDGADEAADLAATALSGGVSASEALRLAADELPDLAGRLRRLAFGLELGMDGDDLAAGGPGAANVGTGPARRVRGGTADRGGAATRGGVVDPLHRVAAIVLTAERTGAPVTPSLRHLARELRADDLARVLAAAERLPAQLTFPTALCLLPATVLLVGAPIVHAGLAAAGT